MSNNVNPGVWLSLKLYARGVGHNEESVTSVRRTNGGSGYALPFRVIPDLGQVSEYLSHPSNKERCNVLHEHVSWS
jgi:hypothetical protein